MLSSPLHQRMRQRIEALRVWLLSVLRRPLLLAVVLVCAALLSAPAAGAAAEVLQVRGATLLQVGDHNRSYPVALACVQVPAEQQEAATAWLRQALPRRARVNLRPIGQRDGTLLAQVSRIGAPDTLGAGLVAAGLAEARPCG